MQPIKPKTKTTLLLIFGSIIGIIGISICIAFPFVFKMMIIKELTITEGSYSYQYWKDIPVPIYLKIYLFNITNPEEVYNLTNKPILEELGPYTFREERTKINIGWNENGTLSYRQIKTWYFRPDLTNGSLDDEVLNINAIMMGAAAVAKKINNEVFYVTLSETLRYFKTQWFVKRKVRELIFDGYTDRLFNFSKPFSEYPFDKFGWFYGRNGTDDGLYTIFNGASDINLLDKMDKFNGLTYVSAYDPPCNMVNGTAGELWSPLRKEGGKISMFISDICRTLHLTYIEKTKFKNLEVFRYWADDTELDNGRTNPDNVCFCKDNNCYPPGSVDVSRCKYDAPATVSYPHFLYADSSYRSAFIGLKPDPDKHKMFIDLEPTLGIPLNVAARMQVNVIFEGNERMEQFRNVTGRAFYPVLWFSVEAEIDGNLGSQVKLIVKTLPLAINVISYFLMGIGFLLIIIALIYAGIYTQKKENSEYYPTKQGTGTTNYVPVANAES